MLKYFLTNSKVARRERSPICDNSLYTKSYNSEKSQSPLNVIPLQNIIDSVRSSPALH